MSGNYNQKRLTEFSSYDPDINDYANDDRALKVDKASDNELRHRIKGYSGSDPFELAEFLREKVCKGNSRKYYRFRGGRFYGGIAAADCVGCVLDCVFCWSYKPRCNPETAGKFYTAKQVVERLMDIAKKNNYNKIRITGNEPTLCREHLLEVLEYTPISILFILETNGILMDKEFILALKPFRNHMHVRVSLKGVTKEQFYYITAMDGKFLVHQYKALQFLVEEGFSCNAAIMGELLNQDNVHILGRKLKGIDDNLAKDLEVEGLIMYPFIESELAHRGLNQSFKHV